MDEGEAAGSREMMRVVYLRSLVPEVGLQGAGMIKRNSQRRSKSSKNEFEKT